MLRSWLLRLVAAISLPRRIVAEACGTALLLAAVVGSGTMGETLAGFEDRPDSSFERLAKTSGADVIVFGHTHRPYTKRVADVLFVNAGSVGKPKDGDPRACYALLDTGGDVTVEFVRLPYDIAAVAGAIRSTPGLPDEFAVALETGH